MTDEWTPLSFRDPENFAARVDGTWYRIASSESAAALRRLRESKVYDELTESGKLVAFDEPSPEVAERVLANVAGTSTRSSGEQQSVFTVAEIAPITYPWEWPNELLVAAALLTLQMRELLLDEGLDLKDASAFNVQFAGSAPVFMDIGSVELWRPNPSWNASRQFIEHFINPLAVGSATSVSAADAWVLGRGKGITSAAARSLMPSKLRRRPGLALLQATTRPVERNQPSEVRFRDESEQDSNLALRATRSLTKRLRKNVMALSDVSHGTTWADYGSREHYSEQDLDSKRRLSNAFVERFAGADSVVLDVGGNDGFTARSVTSADGPLVLVMDADSGALDQLTSALRSDPLAARVMPLVGDITHLTPASGLLDREFAGFHDRVRPAAVLCQAVLHHVVITQGTPLLLAVEALAAFAAPVQIEFAEPDDEKVKILLGQIPNWSGEYSTDALVAALGKFFDEVEIVGRTSPTRVVVEARGLRSGSPQREVNRG